MKALIQTFFYGNPDQYPPIINGSRLLAAAGFEVEIFSRGDGERLNVAYPDAVRIHRFRTETSQSWREYFAFLSSCLRYSDRRACAFIGYDMHGFLAARLVGFRYPRPIIYHCHDFSEADRKLPFGSEIVRFFEHRFARRVDLVVVPDAERAAVMVRELNLTKAPIIIANAPLSREQPAREVLDTALAGQGKRFSQVLFRQGRIAPGHAIEPTLQSMLHWSNASWGFVLMGHGDTDYKKRLEAMAQQLGVANQFAILPSVSYDAVAEFTGGASVGHALYEPVHINNIHISTASNKLMEYMEAGLPLLVSDTPALRRLVQRYGCGVTANEKSPESIAASINVLLGDPNQARLMGASGRRAFEEEFCYNRQFAPIIQFLKSVCDDLKGRSDNREL